MHTPLVHTEFTEYMQSEYLSERVLRKYIMQTIAVPIDSISLHKANSPALPKITQSSVNTPQAAFLHTQVLVAWQMQGHSYCSQFGKA